MKSGILETLLFSKISWQRFKIVLLLSALFSFNSLFAQNLSSDYYCSYQVIGYYPDYLWIPIPDIRYDKYTQVIFFSIYPNSDGSLNTSQIDLARQADFVQSAHDNNVSVLICIGGWNLSSEFSPMAANSVSRTTFINNLKDYCLNHEFDGVVLDWEPVSTATDRNNYTLLIQELKSTLSLHELTLNVAVAALGSEFNTSAINDIDFLHIMAYDMSNDSYHSSYEDAIAAVVHWENFGFPKSKIILGLPFYGRKTNWWYVESYEPYSKIMTDYQPGPDVDEVDGIYFNGIDTIRKKTRYVVDNQYSGVMCWELTQDTQDGTSLLTSISDEILLRRKPDFNCDDLINDTDLLHLISLWLSTDCNSDNIWCDAADLNQSNALTLEDVSIFARSWLFSSG